jgi:hypothetical protein
MQRCLKRLAGSSPRPEPRPRRATRSARRPALEMLESRLLPTVHMYPGSPGVEEIRIDSRPTTIAVAEVGGLITVTANTTVYNHTTYYDQTVPPGPAPATVIDRGLLQRIEIHGESGNNTCAIIATQTPVTIFSGAHDNITVGDAIRGGVR